MWTALNHCCHTWRLPMYYFVDIQSPEPAHTKIISSSTDQPIGPIWTHKYKYATTHVNSLYTTWNTHSPTCTYLYTHTQLVPGPSYPNTSPYFQNSSYHLLSLPHISHTPHRISQNLMKDHRTSWNIMEYDGTL